MNEEQMRRDWEAIGDDPLNDYVGRMVFVGIVDTAAGEDHAMVMYREGVCVYVGPIYIALAGPTPVAYADPPMILVMMICRTSIFEVGPLKRARLHSDADYKVPSDMMDDAFRRIERTLMYGPDPPSVVEDPPYGTNTIT